MKDSMAENINDSTHPDARAAYIGAHIPELGEDRNFDPLDARMESPDREDAEGDRPTKEDLDMENAPPKEMDPEEPNEFGDAWTPLVNMDDRGFDLEPEQLEDNYIPTQPRYSLGPGV